MLRKLKHNGSCLKAEPLSQDGPDETELLLARKEYGVTVSVEDAVLLVRLPESRAPPGCSGLVKESDSEPPASKLRSEADAEPEREGGVELALPEEERREAPTPA